MGNLSTKISKYCATCNLLENDSHLIFHCNFARAVWFSSKTPLRTSLLPLEQDGVQEILSMVIRNNTSDADFQRIMLTLWYIWKARNETRFQGGNGLFCRFIMLWKRTSMSQLFVYKQIVQNLTRTKHITPRRQEKPCFLLQAHKRMETISRLYPVHRSCLDSPATKLFATYLVCSRGLDATPTLQLSQTTRAQCSKSWYGNLHPGACPSDQILQQGAN